MKNHVLAILLACGGGLAAAEAARAADPAAIAEPSPPAIVPVAASGVAVDVAGATDVVETSDASTMPADAARPPDDDCGCSDSGLACFGCWPFCICNGTGLTGLTVTEQPRSIDAVVLPSGESLALL